VDAHPGNPGRMSLWGMRERANGKECRHFKGIPAIPAKHFIAACLRLPQLSLNKQHQPADPDGAVASIFTSATHHGHTDRRTDGQCRCSPASLESDLWVGVQPCQPGERSVGRCTITCMWDMPHLHALQPCLLLGRFLFMEARKSGRPKASHGGWLRLIGPEQMATYTCS
jgi:hypothetical protein